MALNHTRFGSKLHSNELLYILHPYDRLELELGCLISSIAMPKEEWKRKRQKEPIEGSKRGSKPFLGPLKGNPKSSARPIGGTARKNLTLFDWMTVYAYVDTLPHPIKQVDVVNYFATRPEGPLIFTQSTLSRKLQHRSEIKAHVRFKCQCIIKQTTTHCHKTGCGLCLVPVGSAHGAEARGHQ